LTVLSVLAVLAVLFVAAAVATREGPILADAPADVADLGLPDGPLQPEDLQAVRFGLAVRGYRMAEVDAVLDRVVKELTDRNKQVPVAKPSPAAVPAIPVTVKPASAPSPPKEPVVPIEPPLDSPPAPIKSEIPGQVTLEEAAADVDASVESDHATPEQAAAADVSAETGSAVDEPAPDADEAAPSVEVAVVPTEIAPVPATVVLPAGEEAAGASGSVEAKGPAPTAEGAPEESSAGSTSEK
jgi:DivIVA domain-containing protein